MTRASRAGSRRPVHGGQLHAAVLGQLRRRLGDPTAHCQRRVDIGRDQTAELIVRTEVGERCSIRAAA